MKRFTAFADGDIRDVGYGDGVHWIEFSISEGRLQDVVLELLMLLWGESDSWTVGNKRRLIFGGSDAKGRVIELAPNRTGLNLCDDELKAIIACLLRWYRDGISLVDHLDLQLTSSVGMKLLLGWAGD